MRMHGAELAAFKKTVQSGHVSCPPCPRDCVRCTNVQDGVCTHPCADECTRSLRFYCGGKKPCKCCGQQHGPPRACASCPDCNVRNAWDIETCVNCDFGDNTREERNEDFQGPSRIRR